VKIKEYASYALPIAGYGQYRARQNGKPYYANSAGVEYDLTATGVITEVDPVFTASQAFNIDATDITKLGNLSGTNTGDQDISGKLDLGGGNNDQDMDFGEFDVDAVDGNFSGIVKSAGLISDAGNLIGIEVSSGKTGGFAATIINTDTGGSSNGLRVEVANTGSLNTVQRWIANGIELARIKASGGLDVSGSVTADGGTFTDDVVMSTSYSDSDETILKLGHRSTSVEVGAILELGNPESNTLGVARIIGYSRPSSVSTSKLALQTWSGSAWNDNLMLTGDCSKWYNSKWYLINNI